MRQLSDPMAVGSVVPLQYTVDGGAGSVVKLETRLSSNRSRWGAPRRCARRKLCKRTTDCCGLQHCRRLPDRETSPGQPEARKATSLSGERAC